MSKNKVKNLPSRKPVAYDTVSFKVCANETALTVDQCKELLGWSIETDQNKFGNDYLLIDRNGEKVRCLNNVKNRPLYMGSVEALVQEHLQRRWKLNGEPLIIGKYGSVLNGQHTLISVILAEQDRTGENADHWKKKGLIKPITLTKTVVYGIDEDDDTVNTMDTCKPRSLADVIYRSKFFESKKGADRVKASRMLNEAIKFLWLRCGVFTDAYASRRTHAEAIDFVNRHNRLLDCVNQILSEDVRNEDTKQYSISSYVQSGMAAALMYLMAVSDTDPETYHNSDNPSEKLCNFNQFDKAAEFWILFSAGSKKLSELKEGIDAVRDPSGENMREGKRHIVGMICAAWNLFKQDIPIVYDDIKLETVYDENTGLSSIVTESIPSFGGIDVGEAVKKQEYTPTPEEIAAEAAKIRAEKGEETTEKSGYTDDEDEESSYETGNEEE